MTKQVKATTKIEFTRESLESILQQYFGKPDLRLTIEVREERVGYGEHSKTQVAEVYAEYQQTVVQSVTPHDHSSLAHQMDSCEGFMER